MRASQDFTPTTATRTASPASSRSPSRAARTPPVPPTAARTATAGAPPPPTMTRTGSTASARPEVPLTHLRDSASRPHSELVPKRGPSTRPFVFPLPPVLRTACSHRSSSPSLPGAAAAASAEERPFSQACSLLLGLRSPGPARHSSQKSAVPHNSPWAFKISLPVSPASRLARPWLFIAPQHPASTWFTRDSGLSSRCDSDRGQRGGGAVRLPLHLPGQGILGLHHRGSQ